MGALSLLHFNATLPDPVNIAYLVHRKMIEASDGSRDVNDLRPVICVTGMHRSGTSMVARLLSLCGVYLGSPENLSRSAPDNRDGFWENPDFVELNDNLLAMVHAGWDLPPSEFEWAPRPEFAASL